MAEPAQNLGPHQAIEAPSERDRFALNLLDTLWRDYRQRVAHVARYEQLVAAAGARFVNDHVAFRTLAWDADGCHLGIAAVSRLFEALGYEPAGCYCFPDQHLSAIHFQHPHAEFPKLFVSELRLWELSAAARQIAHRSAQPCVGGADCELLAQLRQGPWSQKLLERTVRCLQRLWPPPERSDVLRLNEESQYGAWVLLHGSRVNHFTALVNSHGPGILATIDQTAAALRDAGVPMKESVEGAPGSKLRQTATAAAVVDVEVLEGGSPTRMEWTYAYFELAERGQVVDSASGRAARFEGFLGPQAAQLFEMTRGGSGDKQ